MLIKRILASTEFKPEHDLIFQVSTLPALSSGTFAGDTTVANLKMHGDFGLGTFNDVDGEMIVLDGEVYQVKEDGEAHRAPDEAHTPFAVLTTFVPDQTSALPDKMDREALERYALALLPSRYVIYALKIEGTFQVVKVRSEGRHDRPGTTLDDVVRDQVVFDYTQIAGTMVGFWFPADAEGIDGVGFHFHFISADRAIGGHVLDYRIDHASVALAAINEVSIIAAVGESSLKDRDLPPAKQEQHE